MPDDSLMTKNKILVNESKSRSQTFVPGALSKNYQEPLFHNKTCPPKIIHEYIFSGQALAVTEWNIFSPRDHMKRQKTMTAGCS